MTKQQLLEIKGCSKWFPGVKALNSIDFDLLEGEIHCIIGENGAGKSTLIKILSGALKPDEGIICIGDKKFSSLTPSLAQEMGIRTIYQEISLAPDLTVAENIFMGQEPVNRFGFVDYFKLKKESKKILETLKIDLDVNALVRKLGVPQKQSVQIAKAMAEEAKIFILDEPTASYSSSEISNLLMLVDQVAQNGVGVIYISHHLEEIFDIYSRITVLRDGVKVASHEKGDLSEEKIINEMIGRDVNKFYSREMVDIDYSNAIELKNFSNGSTVNNISFNIHKGEIVGLAGMVGSGRTELVRLIFGADNKTDGTITLEGKETSIKNPKQAIRAGFSLLTEDRKKTGLILDHSVLWNISIVHLCNTKGQIIDEVKERKAAQGCVSTFNIKTPSIKQLARNLSGGNQQKLVLAKWLYADTKMIIFDEPTRGIDIGAKEEIYKSMIQLAKQGKYILIISSDMPELIAMCDRVIVMRQGRLVCEIDRENLNEENILSYSIGGTI
ncbi:MAG: sugar ABC transporter ATP-binding protein [Pelolinea sp.]|nr:sugar ABC transporter ATP-binding protein [Pelolinea sp.]